MSQAKTQTTTASTLTKSKVAAGCYEVSFKGFKFHVQRMDREWIVEGRDDRPLVDKGGPHKALAPFHGSDYEAAEVEVERAVKESGAKDATFKTLKAALAWIEANIQEEAEATKELRVAVKALRAARALPAPDCASHHSLINLALNLSFHVGDRAKESRAAA
jgi:hypothetical protein